jgi:hypothetical protein
MEHPIRVVPDSYGSRHKEVIVIIDCQTCDMRETNACDDCVVSALVGDDGILELIDAEQSAIESMSRVGLVSPIRLVGPQDVPREQAGRRRL